MSGLRKALRWLVPIPLAAAAFVLCRLILADSMAQEHPDKALQWWPWHAEAHARHSKALLVSDGSEAEIEALARGLLSSSPYAGSAYSALAAVAARRGEQHSAAALYRVAARRTPRDRVPHVWLVDHAASVNDFPALVFHVDQLLRLSPSQSASLMPTLASLIANPASRKVLVDFIGGQAPPWRLRFLTGLAAPAQPLQLTYPVFDALRKASVPLTAQERQVWSQRLIREGMVVQAHLLWVEGLPPERREVVGNVYDGGFELSPDNAGFGWHFGRIPGAIIRQQGGNGVEGRQALVVEFQHRNVPFQHVRQTLALPAGNYLLSGQVRLDDLRTDRGLVWLLRCAGGRELARTGPFSGRSSWREFEVGFTVPEEGCAAQQLTLTLPARVKREQWIGGRAWFDAMGIRRQAVEPAAI